MAEIKRICVYCGSRSGNNPAYLEAAIALGEEFARRNIGLVFGGSNVGLMEVIASTVMQHGGETIGFIPQSLRFQEPEHNKLTELHYVATMHERKALMEQYADAFIAMPGGIGTLDEFFEQWTWGKIGLHNKAIGLYNIDHFYDALVTFIQHVVDEGFLDSQTHSALKVSDSPIELIDALIAANGNSYNDYYKR